MKVDTYFQLNPILEEEEIMFATLHLEGVAQEWWHYGLVTLSHNQVTSYIEFTKRLINLVQLRQIGTVNNYITEFQRLSVLVTNISKRCQIVLFMDGLREALRG